LNRANPGLRNLKTTGKVWSLCGAFESFNEGQTVMNAEGGGYLTIAEASRKLGVSPNTLRSWGAMGKIQEYRHPMNNYRLYRQTDVNLVARKLRNPLKVVLRRKVTG
jgi:DNA (cytosine-5)-methyltransferase 1